MSACKNFLFYQQMFWLLLPFMVSSSLANLVENDDNVLHIGGIFPIGGEGGWQGGQVNHVT